MLMPWDGQGLPPAAQARIDRASRDHVRSSLLDIGGNVAVEAVGLDPVGEVMGCIVEHIGFAGWGGCGVYSGFGSGGFGSGGFGPARTVTSSAQWGGYKPYVDAIYHGYDTALYRMLLETQALGGDGVVGVSWTQERLGDTGAREFVARGTAVRARTATRPQRLFSTDLSGAETATLLHGGWAPVALTLGVSVAIRHDDYQTRRTAWSYQNAEVPGYTELVMHTRADARDRFEQRAARAGADAATVSDMKLHIWGIEPSEGHHDHVAEATVVGNSVAKFHAGDRAVTDSLLVLPLRRRTL